MRGLLPVLRGQWFLRIGSVRIVVLAKPVLCRNPMDKAARGRNNKAQQSPRTRGLLHMDFFCVQNLVLSDYHIIAGVGRLFGMTFGAMHPVDQLVGKGQQYGGTDDGCDGDATKDGHGA